MKGLKSLFVIGLVFSATALFAGKHPVPLDKNTDSAKCIECHEDKAKAKAVHSAIATGCTSCHEIRVNKDVTRIKLTTATPQALCLTCHADKNASEIKGKVHPPAVRDCLKCHDPHTSANQFQLLKATSGDKPDNLCLQCHDIGVNVPEKGSRHAALDSGCDTCHTIHKSGERGKQEFDYHLKKAAPALCADCHDVNDAALVKAHQGQPFAKADCTTCHDPHQSAGPKLMQKFVHAAFAGNSCDTCHAEPKDGKVVLTQADSRALCVTCHEEQAKKIETAKVQHPGAQGECIACHNPHAGKTPGFLQPNPVDACLACHADQAEQGKKAFRHQPAFAQGCATCHEPHGGDNQHLLRVANVSSLCMECHGPEARPVPEKDSPLVTIFGGQVKLPANYFSKVPRIPVRYGLGHPVEHHPVIDQMDPTDNSKVRVAMNCASCHQPHSSAQPNLLANDLANGVAFCANCHKDLGK